MKEEYISISEFAKRAGVSRQAIQQRLDTSLSRFVKVAQGKKLLHINGLSLFNGASLAQGFDKENDKVAQGVIDLLREELEAKNKQIEQLQRLLDQQQQLHAASLKALPSGSMQQCEDPSEATPSSKRNLFAKIFLHKKNLCL